MAKSKSKKKSSPIILSTEINFPCCGVQKIDGELSVYASEEKSYGSSYIEKFWEVTCPKCKKYYEFKIY